MLTRKIFPYFLCSSLALTSLITNTALACVHPPPPKKPPRVPEVICHDDGSVWIKIGPFTTFGGGGQCGCGLRLAGTGTLTSAALINQQDGTEIFKFGPGGAANFEAVGKSGVQGLATASDLAPIEEGLGAFLMFDVKRADGASCMDVKRAVKVGGVVTDKLDGSGNATGDHLGDPTPPPLLLELMQFTAEKTASGTVNLNWEVASERDVTGYHIYKGKLNNIERVTSPVGVPNEGGLTEGYSYSHEDTLPSPGVNVYILEAIDSNQNSTFFLNEGSVVIE